MTPPSSHLMPIEHIPNNSLPPDGRNNFSPRHHPVEIHTSIPIPNSHHQREQNHLPYTNQRSPDKHIYHQSTDKIRINYPESGRFSPFQRRLGESPPPDGGGTNHIRTYPDTSDGMLQHCVQNPLLSPYQQRRANISDKMMSDGFWQSPMASPLPIRKHYHTPVTEQQYANNTSPILLQRFFHQQKQLQQQAAAEKEQENKDDHSGKKRFASHIKLQLVGDRSSLRAGRHQSPEPPPRLSRGSSTESSVIGNQSPMAIRRNFLEASSAASPSLSRR